MSVSLDATGIVAAFFWLCVGGILYTYIGYPILIFLLARLRTVPKKHKPNYPFVTLLIAAYNEENAIGEKIKNCLELDYPRDKLQTLVVTDGSTDKTPEIIKKFDGFGVELLHQPERQGKMAAINRAVSFIRGEIVVFSDANNFYQPDTIRKLVKPFSDPEIGAVSGEKVIAKGDGNLGESEGTYWKYESFIKKQESRLGSCTSAVGEILAIRKNLYVPPPNHVINDDFYIAMQIIRQGYRLTYVPDAKSIERVSMTVQDEIVRRTRINTGRYQAIAMAKQFLPFRHPILVWQIISHKFLRPLVPLFMLGAVISNIIAVLNPSPINNLTHLGLPYNIILLGIQILFYTLAFIGQQFPNRSRQSRLINILYLPTFLTNSNLAALKGLIQFVRGGQSHLWERIQRR